MMLDSKDLKESHPQAVRLFKCFPDIHPSGSFTLLEVVSFVTYVASRLSVLARSTIKLAYKGLAASKIYCYLSR